MTSQNFATKNIGSPLNPCPKEQDEKIQFFLICTLSPHYDYPYGTSCAHTQLCCALIKNQIFPGRTKIFVLDEVANAVRKASKNRVTSPKS